MADLSQVYEALRRADAAGNVDDARKLAQFIQSQTALPEAPVVEKPGTAGPIEALVGGAKRLGASSLTALQAPFVGGEEAAARGVARQEAITERPGASLDEIKKIYQEKGFLPAAKEAITQIPAGLAEQAPNIAAMLASGRLGAMAGSAFGPVGTAVGGIGGALIPSFLPQAGANIERQRQEGKEIELGKAYGAAIPQAALDVGAMEFGLGKVFKINPSQLGTEAAEKLAKDSLLKAAGKGALKTAAFEMPTEVTQQMLERAQADLPLTTPDAIKEYTDVAYAAGLLSPLGGVSGVSQRGEARDVIRQNDLVRAQELGRIQMERDRIDQMVEDAKQEAQLNLEEETKKNKIDNDTFKDLGIGPTAKVGPADNRVKLYDELSGLDVTNPEDNAKIRSTFESFLKNKTPYSKQYENITNYLDTLPKLEELQDETAVVERPRESVQVPGQPLAGGLTERVEGVDRTGLGGVTDNVQQLAGREEGRPSPLEEVTSVEAPKVKPSMGVQAYLKQRGGISTEHIQDLTGEKSVNKSGAAVGLFTKQGRGLDDAVQLAVEGGYLPSTVLNEVDGGVEALGDLIENEIYGKKAVPLDQQADSELEAYLAREEQKAAMAETAAPTKEADLETKNAEIRNIINEQKNILEAPPTEMAEPTPIYNEVTNAQDALKALTKVAKNQPEKALINLLKRVPNIGTTRFTTTREVESTGKAPGYYDPNTNHIFVNPKSADHVQVTLHEIYHAATDAELDKHVREVNGRPTGITPLGKKAVRLFEAFNQAAAKKNRGFYAQNNIKEFFSEAETNPELKQFLQNQEGVLGLKPAKGKIQTLWSDFVNLIKSMFNVPDSAHSLLDEILLLSPQFMTGPEAVTAPKQVLEARRAPEGLTRPDGTPLKYLEEETKSAWEKIGDVWSSDNNQWRKWGDWLGNKIVGGRYSLERKGIDAGLPEVDLLNGGRIRGDLINLQATNGQSIAQAGLYLGRLDVRKSGMVIADRSTGDFKVSMLDISTGWNNLIGRATEDLGSKELAYDMLTAGWYGPRYEELARYNETAKADEKINIDEWTESDKRTAKEAWRRYGAELAQLREMRNVQRKDLLDFMVKTGLYTKEKAQRFLDRSEYVALYRVPEEEMEAYEAKPFTKVGGLLGAAKEYRLIGSKRAAADPMDNYIANMSWMMQRGIKNNAAKHTADLLQQIGQGQWMDRPLTDVEKKAVNYVSVNIDGTPKDFVVADANDMAAFASSPVITGAVWDIMKYPVSGLRHGITMMPQFVWNQAWEDPIRATFVSGNRAGFAKNIKDTWTSIVKNQFSSDRTPNAELLNRYGIIGQKDILDSQDLIDKYKGKDKSGWRKYVFVLERMAQGSDLGAREAIYKNAIAELTQQGMDPELAQDYAAVRAHQYMPYQQTGTSRSLAYLRRMMPFVNPPIQGLARDIAAARGRIGGISRADGKKALAWRLAKYAAFTAMYAAFMSGDDEYENQSDDQQDNNFFLGGARIPVPQELRPLKVAIERSTRAWVLDAPGADVEDAAVIGTTLRKFWEITAGFAPVPTIARPLAENYTNFNIFSGLPIVSRGQEMKEPAYQYTDRTSEIAKVIGQSINYSPIKIDNIIKGYGGYMGSTLAQMTNYLSDDRPAPTINETLFIGSMLQNEQATGARSDFFNLYDKTTRVKATLNALKDSNDIEAYRAYMEKNKGYIGIAPAVNALHNQVNKLRDVKKSIINSNKSAEEKRELLDKITANESNMLSRVRDLERKALEAQD
jgi:hypothetical protein